MQVKDWLWVIVTIITMTIGSFSYIHKTFASDDAMREANATLQAIHQYDFYDTKQEYYRDKINYLEQKQEAVGLTPSEEYDLNHLRGEVQRFQNAQEELLGKIAE